MLYRKTSGELYRSVSGKSEFQSFGQPAVNKKYFSKNNRKKDQVNRFIIIGNGELDDTDILRKYIRKNDIIVAVDGGFDHINKLSLKPDYMIGDMDSIKYLHKNDNSINILKFPAEKDKTDTELAIEFALNNKASEILLFAMTSRSRIDHSLNNIFLLEDLARKGIENTLFANNFTRLSAVKNNIKLYKKNGILVSLLPLTQIVKGITTKGLKYKLINGSLYRDKAMGVSNVMNRKEAEIRLSGGVLLVIQVNIQNNI